MRLRTPLLATAAAGALTVGYASLGELTHWTLRRVSVPVLPRDTEPMTILHLSDLHLTPGQRSKQAWVRSLDDLDPDLVVVTGDNLAHADAVPYVVGALGPLLDRPGLTVFSSNDYFAPKPKNPLKYLNPDYKNVIGRPLPWQGLRDAMVGGGWSDVTNRRAFLDVGGRRVVVAGLDDPHIGRDDYPAVAGAADPAADLRLGLVHTPQPRVLDDFSGDGYDLVLAGHTHGGQLRVPFYGALVTNCGISRDKARGLSRWSDSTWLNVSAGLGTSPFTPVRFACPPEATLLTLVARGEEPA